MYKTFKKDEKLFTIINSEQFPYSEKIMELRIASGLSISDFASKIDYPLDEYINIEYCDLDIPLIEYKKILDKIYKLGIFNISNSKYKE